MKNIFEEMVTFVKDLKTLDVISETDCIKYRFIGSEKKHILEISRVLKARQFDGETISDLFKKKFNMISMVESADCTLEKGKVGFKFVCIVVEKD